MEILTAQKCKDGYVIKIVKRFKISSSKKLSEYIKENEFEIKPQFSVLNDDRFFLLHAEREDNERSK